MPIKITILGSGTGVPSLKRSACSVLMEIETDKLLFDLGAGTMRRLLEAGLSITQVTYLFFSHLHPDHTGEFASFLFATKYFESRNIPLVACGAKGLEEFYSRLRNAFEHWIDLEPAALDFIEFSNSNRDRLNQKNFNIDTLPTAHIDSSIGYRVTAGDGTSVVYTGDTDYTGSIIDFARNADLLICEASLPDELKAEGHLTPSLAGRIAAEANVRNLILTHFYPECEGVDIAAQCRKTYAGPLRLAEDLMRTLVTAGGHT